ncbi:MAG: fasciclin domain-containing protein, partial [Bacilli bacterium]|nr:fasciclin domain-containing protein [Bacilli bacterium]
APTDAAFSALPEGTLAALLNDTAALEKLLLYHVTDQKLNESELINLTEIPTLEGSELPVNVTAGGAVMVGDAMIVMSDIQAINGVIHAIDAVLLPPEDGMEMDIVEVVTEDGNFSTLLTALEATNLADTLKETGPFTVFAPTDAAFSALPEGTLAALLNDTAALEKLLLYHVTDQKLNESDLINLTEILTLEGSKLSVNVTAEGAVMVDDAMIIMSDIQASNGVIHAIDAVLLPPEEVKPGMWHFFSVPRKAMNSTAEYLLMGVDYDALIHYNNTAGLYENVNEIEPLKGYWILVPAGRDFNTTEIFASIKEEMPATPTSLHMYQGWNAVGSPVLSALSAEVVFTSIDPYYAKVVGPWVPNEVGSGSYSYVGYNGQSGMLNGNQMGTDNFTVEPYEGYWVYVLEESILA